MRSARRILPGFGLSLGYTVMYLSLVVVLPLSALFLRSATMSRGTFWGTVSSESVLSAYWMSLSASLLAAVVNLPLGILVAWVLVRYDFFGKRLLDAIIDLPFALPTAVAGIALATVYGPRGWVGKAMVGSGMQYPWAVWEGFGDGRWMPLKVMWWGKVSQAPLGIMIALMFIGLPFVVRTLQPVLEDMNPDVEEAAASLGANRLQTFWRVLLPQLYPAILTALALAFARGLGEYGSVLFIAGTNQAYTDIAPHEIIARLNGSPPDYDGATAIAVVLLVLSFGVLLSINVMQRVAARRTGEKLS